MAFASYLHQISLFDPFWRNETRVSVSGLRASWAVNAPGRLSCLIRSGTRLPWSHLRGLWVFWEHPTCGPWGGFVEDVPDDFDANTIEIGCVSMAGLLGIRIGPRLDRPTRATAGALAFYALRNSQIDAKLPFEEMVADERGPDLEMQWRGETTLATWQSLQSASGQDWNVTIDTERRITPEWRYLYGRDLTGSILIADGYQLAGGRREDSLATVVNDAYATTEDRRWEARQLVRAEDADSITANRQRRQQLIRYPNVVRESSLRATVERDLETLAQPAYPVTVRLAADNHLGVFNVPLRVREGDRVRLWRAGLPNPLIFRVMEREVDTLAGAVTLTGTAEEDV